MTIQIATFSGRMIDLINPTAAMIELADIAHALAQTCRWSGHTCRFYSVAEHCVRVSHEAETLARAAHLTAAQVAMVSFEGLMHDAEEAYPPGDIASPLRNHVVAQPILDVVGRVREAIAERFGLCASLPQLVTDADRVMLATEARDLMGNHWAPDDCDPQPHVLSFSWGTAHAELAFLARFQHLRPESIAPAIQRALPASWRTEAVLHDSRYPAQHVRPEAIAAHLMMRDAARWGNAASEPLNSHE